MTFSYDVDALAIELNKIRLYLGDTNEDDVLLEDEEIALIQGEYSSFYARVAECCRLICQKVIRRVDGKFGNLTEKSSVIYERYKALEERMDGKSSSSYPWMGTLNQSDKDTMKNAQDEGTYVKPKVRKGMMDNT
jgi:hypothetical protein